MSASARPHTVLTILAGGLLAMAAPATAAAAAPPPVTVAVESVTVPAAPAPATAPATQPGTAGTAPAYRIEVRNASNSSVETTVRQELPPGTSPTRISPGGRTTAPGTHGPAAPGGGTEVTWQLKLAAGSAATLRTDLAPVPPSTPVAAPACAFATSGETAYDCATATWQAAQPRPAPAPPPWWRQPVTIVAGLAGLLLVALISGGWRWRQRRIRRSAAVPATGDATPTTGAGALPHLSGIGPADAPRFAVPRPVPQRNRPAWPAVSLALILVLGVATAVVWTAADRVTAVKTERQPSSGAWIGRTSTGQVGTVLRDSSFEFTVYRLACPDAGPSGRQRCLATVELHNVSGRSELWHGQLQRAYLPDGNWIGTDEAATQAANNGRNPFADPVPAGERMLLPLVFTTPGPAPPTRIELRAAVFSAGISVEVPR